MFPRICIGENILSADSGFIYAGECDIETELSIIPDDPGDAVLSLVGMAEDRRIEPRQWVRESRFHYKEDKKIEQQHLSGQKMEVRLCNLFEYTSPQPERYCKRENKNECCRINIIQNEKRRYKR